jgi:hypothetical protein
MALITSRFTRNQMSVLTVSGVNITDLVTDASLEVTVDQIDANALKDAWNQREYGRGDWTLSVTKYVTDTTTGAIFPSMAVSRDPVFITVVLAGDAHFFTFTGKALATAGPLTIGDMITEESTFVSAGGSPVISRS